MKACDILDLLSEENDEDGLIYDRVVEVEDLRIHVHHTNDGPIFRIVAPMASLDGPAIRNLAYDLATESLSDTTNNDACDVTVRERSAHFASHEDLRYLDVPDDLSVVVVEAWVGDYLT